MTVPRTRMIFLLMISLILVCGFVFLESSFCADESVKEGVDWNYALTSLAVRFIGIIVVLGILQLAMYMSGWVFARIERKSSKEPDPDLTAEQLTDQEAAAISIGLFLYQR
jgi:hypothetical protein